jgi:hypothetical protein
MSQLEFLITLLSIIVGLGLADLARSVRNLVRPRQPVRWHWLPLAWVIITFLMVANFWWGYYDGLQLDVWRNYFAFLLLLGEVMSLYLVCAFALPDLQRGGPMSPSPPPDPGAPSPKPPDTAPDPDTALDLETFYFSTSHRRWFFGVVIILLGFVEATESVEQAAIATPAWDVGETLRLLLAGSAATLIATDREWVHGTVTIGVLVGFTYFIFRFATRLN